MALADFKLTTRSEGLTEAGEAGAALLTLTGDWKVTRIQGLASRLRAEIKGADRIALDTRGVTSLDTAGAYLISSALGERLTGEAFADQPEFKRLFQIVAEPTSKVNEALKTAEAQKPDWMHPHIVGLADIGRFTVGIIADFKSLSVFVGHLVVAFGRAILNPGRIRWAALFSQMQHAGLEAIAIVAVTNFFVGAVIAFLGIEQLQLFGASVFAVELLGISVVREFGPVLAAVLLAGRSSSSFAAEVGAMKMNQEIDAMKVLGIDPFDALVMPRVVGMVLMTPLVSFIACLAGLFAGVVIIWTTLGYPPSFFIERYYNYVGFVNFFVGMIKTPLFAVAIAIIGCRNGMEVGDDVISLGRQVTKSVVQAIFMIIMIDAMIAIMFNGFDFK